MSKSCAVNKNKYETYVTEVAYF